MSRDMQIGLLLAVGFLALVGGVLYYRIEHPDELEQYLNGGSQAQATAPSGKEPDTSKPDQAPQLFTGNTASTPNNVTPPSNTTPPAFDINIPANPGTTPPNPGGSTTVVQTGTGNPATASPTASMPPPPSNNSAPGLDLTLDTKPKDNKPPVIPLIVPDLKKDDAGNTASRTSLPAEPPAAKSNPATNPPPTSTSINFDIPTNSKPPAEVTRTAENKPEDKKPEEKKPLDLVIKPEAPSGASPALTPPGITPPSAGSITIPDLNKPAPPTSTTPDLNKSLEMPQPPVVTPPASNKPVETTRPPMNSTTPLNTTIRPDNTSVPSGNNPLPNQSTTDADGFRTYPAKVSLGKPMPESEATMRERRWADSSGGPSPIIPSSSQTQPSVNSAPLSSQGDRKVVRDTYIPTERAQRGETFSSLSQRLYGDTNYAMALAAFNKEEGLVKMDQPEANEWVAKPNREILDQRFPHLIRRLTPTSINNMRAAPVGNPGGNNTTATTAVSTNLPTYRVGKGEQLFEVAKKTLGDGYRWSEIYVLNKELLRDSTELRPDMVLKLPAEARK